MALGTVRYFDTDRGFGYITPDDGSGAVTVHSEEIVDSPMSGGLMLGWRVEYEEAADKKGRIASEVSVVEIVIDDDEPEEHEHAMAGPPPDVVME